MKYMASCVLPKGLFQYGLHKPSYSVTNLREATRIETLGLTVSDEVVDNRRNYPEKDIREKGADWIYEIPNPFPFKGRTFIDKEWADASAKNPDRIRLPRPQTVSLTKTLGQNKTGRDFIKNLPEPLLLALATSSTDPEDLVTLAELSCDMTREDSQPTGLRYSRQESGKSRPVIHNHPLFEAVANNPNLPDDYKVVMVIRPGAQGGSEIVGEWPKDDSSHVYEYLRRNSYIPGGHYAANMAEDAIRYSIADLSRDDLRGLRHLYYQRSYLRLVEELEISTTFSPGRRVLSETELEELRMAVMARLEGGRRGPATLWGWNFGFDFAPSHYRLHASHQQIHQQYAMVPDQVAAYHHGTGNPFGQLDTYSCGDLVAEWIEQYYLEHQSDFFEDYRQAIAANRRMDDRPELESSLIVWQDERVLLFVPKAQTSQWELQLMTLPGTDNSLAGNIFECDSSMRLSLDTGILMAQKALAGLGARMVTSIEYCKRISGRKESEQQPAPAQPLLYALLPKLPESMGAFSEAQLRFINGHYPEDFAAACRRQLAG